MLTLGKIDDIERRLTGVRTRRVWDYWRRQAGDDKAPTWDRFKLMDIYQDTPIILVLDTLDGPGPSNYSYRFVGTTIVQYRWRLEVSDHTGLTYFEAEHQYNFDEIKGAYDRCRGNGLPILMQRNFDAHDASGTHERLILPIKTPSSAAVDKLVVVVERLKEIRKATPADTPLF
ncbi:MAG: hypothetical protein RIC50_09525 [Rhodospirillales bacterium]